MLKDNYQIGFCKYEIAFVAVDGNDDENNDGK